MLTGSEKRWLRSRKLTPMAYCVWCRKCDLGFKTHSFRQCPTDYAPADDFEVRVATKLANPKWAVCRNSDSCLEFGGHKDERWVWDCEWCRLKHARITVEEEMMDA